MDQNSDARAPTNYLDVVPYLVGVAGLAASLTIVWLGMRAVLNVGGYCAEGGPYVIAQHCPDGVALALPFAIFGGLGSAGLMGWMGSRLGGPWGGLVTLAWPALFISLGWNFLEFAFFPPAGETGVELGWLIPGILFVIMGAVPLVGFLPGGKAWKPTPAASTFAFTAPSMARDDAADGQRSILLRDLLGRATEQALEMGAAHAALPAPAAEPPAVSPSENASLVSQLERLDALHRSGSLTYDEFQRAKQALLTGGAA